jgi:hypothetical protein
MMTRRLLLMNTARRRKRAWRFFISKDPLMRVNMKRVASDRKLDPLNANQPERKWELWKRRSS